MAAAATDPGELGKLRWRCRRGMKELDVLLARYMDERFCSASAILRIRKNSHTKSAKSWDKRSVPHCSRGLLTLLNS